MQSPHVADLLVTKSLLEDSGIQCYLKNELSTQVLNYLPSMVVELQIAEEDMEKAMQILDDQENQD